MYIALCRHRRFAWIIFIDENSERSRNVSNIMHQSKLFLFREHCRHYVFRLNALIFQTTILLVYFLNANYYVWLIDLFPLNLTLSLAIWIFYFYLNLQFFTPLKLRLLPLPLFHHFSNINLWLNLRNIFFFHSFYSFVNLNPFI